MAPLVTKNIWLARWALWSLGLLVVFVGVGTTTARAAIYTYDGPTIARVEVHSATVAGGPMPLATVSAEWTASTSVESQGPSTTSSGSFVATNRATHEFYTDGLREVMERPHVVDAELSGLMDDLYRPGATVGSGSTAAAVRAEAATGVPVGGSSHTLKAQGYSRALERWIASNPTALPGDRAAAENVLRDLQNALGG